MYKIIILISLFLVTQQVYAENLNFETTEEGIINALIKAKHDEQIKTRSLKRSVHTKTRSIRVVAKEHGQMIEKIITVTEDPSAHGVNLKIEFDFDSSVIRQDSFSLLGELGRALGSKKLKDETVVIKGHTDSDGDPAYNLQLSLQRADAVKSYLMSYFSIAPSRLRVFGYGEAVPLVPNTSSAHKQINRRVEIGILSSP